MQIEGLSKLPEQILRNDVKKEFTAFIQDFLDANNQPKYRLAVRDTLNNSKHHIVFGFKDLMRHNSELANLIFH